MTRQLSGARKQKLMVVTGAALALAGVLVAASLGVPTSTAPRADLLASAAPLPDALLLSNTQGTRYFHTLDLSGTTFTAVKAITRAELQIHIALASGTLPLVLQTTVGALTKDAVSDGARLAAWPLGASTELTGVSTDQTVTVDVLAAIKRYAGGQVTFAISVAGPPGSTLAASDAFIDFGDLNTNGVRLDPTAITLSFDTTPCEVGCNGTATACSAMASETECESHNATGTVDMGCEWKSGGVCQGTFQPTCAAQPAASCTATGGLLSGKCQLSSSSCGGTLSCSGRTQSACSAAPCNWVGDTCTAKDPCTESGAACDAVASKCNYTASKTGYTDKSGATCNSVYGTNGDCNFGCTLNGPTCGAGSPQACTAIPTSDSTGCTAHNCSYAAATCSLSSGPSCASFPVNGNVDNCSPHNPQGCRVQPAVCSGTYDTCGGTVACANETDPKYCTAGGCSAGYADDCSAVSTTDPKLAAQECDKYCGGVVAPKCSVMPKYCESLNVDGCSSAKASCTWNGKTCEPNPASTTCSQYTTQVNCSRNPNVCAWSGAYTCATQTTVKCGAADAFGCNFVCSGRGYDCSALPPGSCPTNIGCALTKGVSCAANGCPTTTSGNDTTACNPGSPSCTGTYACSTTCNGDTLCTYSQSGASCTGGNPQCPTATNAPTCTTSDAYCSYAQNGSTCTGTHTSCSTATHTADYCTTVTTPSQCAPAACTAGSCDTARCFDSGNYCTSGYSGCSDPRLQADKNTCTSGGCTFTSQVCQQNPNVAPASCGDTTDQATCEAASGCSFTASGCAKRANFACTDLKDQKSCGGAKGCDWAAPCPVNTAPVLSGPLATPTQGASGDTFAFQVTYTDAEGQAPRPGMPLLTISVNGVSVASATETTAVGTSDDFTKSVVFSAQVKLDTLGTYHFCFDAIDGPGLAAAQVCADGPIVVAPLAAVTAPSTPDLPPIKKDNSGASGVDQGSYAGGGTFKTFKCSSGPNGLDIAVALCGIVWTLKRRRR